MFQEVTSQFQCIAVNPNRLELLPEPNLMTVRFTRTSPDLPILLKFILLTCRRTEWLNGAHPTTSFPPLTPKPWESLRGNKSERGGHTLYTRFRRAAKTDFSAVSDWLILTKQRWTSKTFFIRALCPCSASSWPCGQTQ